MKSVAFVHGWSEGKWQSRPFVGALKHAGFEVAKSDQADIIVAHSSGCYADLDRFDASLILLIGPTMWPGRTLFSSAARKLKEDLYTSYNGNYLGWLNKIAHNWWYVVAKPRASAEAFQLIPKRLPHTKQGQKIILIRNRLDTFCHPKVAQFIAKDRGYEYIGISGGHDDCWTNPEPYINLIKKYANKLA